MPKWIPTPQTPASMNNIAERIERVAASLRACAISLETQGFEWVEAAGQDSLERGMRQLETFERACWDAHHKRREELGHYRGSTKPSKSK